MLRVLSGGGNAGKLMIIIGLLLFVPAAVLPFYPDEWPFLAAFFIPALLSVLLGFLACALTGRNSEAVSEWQSPLQRGSITILFIWLYCFLAGAAPFVISGRLDFIRALFESVSGWTTTGITVVDLSAAPHVFLFYRSFMQYCGGMGFVIMMVMVVKGRQNMALFNAESHFDQLMPSLRKTARSIAAVYGGFLIIGTGLYRLFGMRFFDAVCHAMSALSTSGFSTRADGLAGFDSLPIELVTVLLMLIGASNFAILLMLTEGKITKILRVTELRFMIAMMAIFVPAMALSLMKGLRMGASESFRHALFAVVTSFSTSGYSIMSYSEWPSFAKGLILLLMLIGGGAGSTSGGIKMARVYIMLRVAWEYIRKRLSPSFKMAAPSYNTVRGRTPIDGDLIADTFGYTICFFGVFLAGTLAVTLTSGSSLGDAMIDFASALSTAGISGAPESGGAAALFVKMAGMVLGRLEIFVVLIGIYSVAHKLKRKLFARIRH